MTVAVRNKNNMEKTIQAAKYKFIELMKGSLFKDDKPSSSRIFGYVMMLIIFLFSVVFIATEIGNAILSWKNGNVYVPSWQTITFFGMCLTQKLTLLGIYKKAESLIPKKTIEKKPVQ